MDSGNLVQFRIT